MKLSQTESALSWLRQFSPEDQIAATLLVDAIQITTTDHIKSDIEAATQEIIESSSDLFYVSPIISREDVRHHLGLDHDDQRIPSMFDMFKPHEILNQNSGSENYLALVARDIRRKFPSQADIRGEASDFELIQTSENQLAFIFIVDNSMSGKQVTEFLESFWSSALVESLLEMHAKRVQIHLVCWGATPEVIAKLDSGPESLKVNRIIVTEVPTVATAFPQGEALDAVMRLVQKYPKKANPGKKGRQGLGFGDTGALFLPLGSSAPNNMPDLLIRNGKKTNTYKAIFPDRLIPPDVKAMTPEPPALPVRNVQQFNDRLRAQRLKTAAKICGDGRSKDWAMILLMALGYTPTQIRGELGLSYAQSRIILAKLVRIGWATEAFTLTAEGNDGLRNFGRRENYSEFRHGVRFMKKKFDEPKSFYYPKSVRGVK